MAVMSIGETRRQRGPWTVDDLERLPDDGNRYELVAGWPDVSPAPVYVHTRIQYRLCLYLGALGGHDFEVLPDAGINFNAEGSHHRRPDLSIVTAEPVQGKHLARPPVLAVEVLSPESVLRDNHIKRREYARFGIGSYWIVNPSEDKPSIRELRLDGDQYREVQHRYDHDVFETEVPFPITLIPHWVVADGRWMDHIHGRSR